MDWKKAIGFGVALWILMFVIVSVLLAFKLYISDEPSIIVAILAGIVAYFLAGYAKPSNRLQGFKFGLTWVAVGLILDWLITTKFAPEIFQDWTLWFGYALVLAAPVLQAGKK